MTQITLEGFSLEQNTPELERFFQKMLRQFGIIRAMLLRAAFDLMALFFFAAAVYRLVLEYNPTLMLSIKAYYPLLGILGFFLGDLYYKPFETLLQAKKTAPT